ncbi:MAG: ABC transporter ATP-binding protein [Phycisphaeraceae bacterium]|nr:ABC transporter ATP-binding protein [Phycisphaeraceae bacterium]MCW5755416.1 ABC transporter ATP-binding protein [Phycisphaeraceae bacterium]
MSAVHDISRLTTLPEAGGLPAAQAPAAPAPAEPALDHDVVIEARDLGKCYHIYTRPADRLRQAFVRRRKLYREFWALQGLDLMVRRGEAIGIVGRNGSGKSTLMQLIAGVLTPTTGSVTVCGRVAALLELGSGFNPDFTGRENAYLYGAILGLTREQVDQRFDAIAAFADIGAFMDQPLKTYSSGMKMRVAFAVQVQIEPEVLIIDEALSVGDNLFQKRCKQRLAALRDQGVTLLFVSHSEEAVRTLTTRCLLLHQGRARAVGKPADVLLEYRRLLHAEEKAWADARTAQFQKAALPDRPPVSAAADITDKSFGDLDACIERVEVLDGDGERCGQFLPGEPMIIRVSAIIRKTLTHLNIGVRIRNKEGVKMYSWGTLNQDISVWAGRPEAPDDADIFWERTFEAGQRITVEFSCPCRLGGGFYEVQALIAEEAAPDYSAERMLHWRDEAAFFTVAVPKKEYYFGGVTDMQMHARVRDNDPS